MPDGGVEKRSRNAARASLACSRCKRAKRRCDIFQPGNEDSCSSCRAKDVDCDVRLEDDKRRGKSRSTNKDLDYRLAALEELIRTGRIGPRDLPSSEPKSKGQIEGTDEQNGLSNDSIDVVVSPEANTTIVSPVDETTNTNDYGTIAFESNLASPTAHPTSMQSLNQVVRSANPAQRPDAERRRSAFKAPSTMSDASSTVMNEVTAREGELKGDAAKKMQFFGATSMFYHGAADEANQSAEDNVEDLKMRKHCADAIGFEVEPEPIVVHLIDLFFEWQACHLNVVDRDMFLLHKTRYDESEEHEDRNFYSIALLYAIMSLASLISLDRGVKRYSTTEDGQPGEAFIRKAQALLDIEIATPAATTVQASLLVASWYGAVGRTSLGWNYSGLTFRICYELGLHMNCSRAVSQGQITQEIAENRKRIFWGCYIQDKLWSAYTGRPSFFMDWDISVAVPERPDPASDYIPGRDISIVLREGKVYLAKRISETLLSLYSQRHNSKPSGLLKFATRVHRDLYRWHEQLPPELIWPRQDDQRPSPGMLIMHMQFYFTLILIHRPLLHMSVAQQAIAQSEHGSIDSATVCTLAATNIAKCVRDYQQFYGLKRISSPAVHFTFIAATIHIVDAWIHRTERSQAWLQGCFSALTEMGESYPIGQKAVGVLRDIIKRWKIQSEQAKSPENANQSPSAPLPSSRSTFQASNEAHRNGTDGFGPFDWSEYNSPIERPPIFDASMVPIPGIDFRESDFESQQQTRVQGLCFDQPAFSEIPNDGLAMANDGFDVSWPFDDSAISAFYGSSSALWS